MITSSITTTFATIFLVPATPRNYLIQLNFCFNILYISFCFFVFYHLPWLNWFTQLDSLRSCTPTRKSWYRSNWAIHLFFLPFLVICLFLYLSNNRCPSFLHVCSHLQPPHVHPLLRTTGSILNTSVGSVSDINNNELGITTVHFFRIDSQFDIQPRCYRWASVFKTAEKTDICHLLPLKWIREGCRKTQWTKGHSDHRPSVFTNGKREWQEKLKMNGSLLLISPPHSMC